MYVLQLVDCRVHCLYPRDCGWVAAEVFEQFIASLKQAQDIVPHLAVDFIILLLAADY